VKADARCAGAGRVGVFLAVAAGALRTVDAGRKAGALDGAGAAVLGVGLFCLVGPILAARELSYAWWLWAIEAFGAVTLVAFLPMLLH